MQTGTIEHANQSVHLERPELISPSCSSASCGILYGEVPKFQVIIKKSTGRTPA